jgi:hypothetical protein
MSYPGNPNWYAFHLDRVRWEEDNAQQGRGLPEDLAVHRPTRDDPEDSERTS